MQKNVSGKGHSSLRFLVRNKKPLLFLGLLFYLYFRGIGDHGFLDPLEGVNASIPLSMLARGGYFMPRVGDVICAGKTMGSWWLSAFSLFLFGWGEFSVRFWPALAGLGMALAAVLIVRRSGYPFWTRRTWLTASISASMTLGFAVSQIASSHALYACCMGFVMAAFIRIERHSSEREARRWTFVAHAASLVAFIIHGPEGLLLPWLALLFFSVLTRRFGTLKVCVSWWPAAAFSLLGMMFYLLLLSLENPMLLQFMIFESPKYLVPSSKLVITCLLMGTIPWTGFIIRAVWEVSPKSWGVLRSGAAAPEFFMVLWAFFFGLFALLMGDLLALGACVPALAALVGVLLDRWLEADAPGDNPTEVNSLQIAVALNIVILVPLVLAGIPLAVKAFPILHGALLSLVPWGLFTLIFLFASWHYARRNRNHAAWTQQMAKLARNGSIIVLLCLMPLAGVFDLAAEQLGLRNIGLTLRGTVKREDRIIQYAVHRPSVFFYTLHNYILVNSPQIPGFASRGIILSDMAMHNVWNENERAYLLISRNQQPLYPLPQKVYNIMETNGMALLSNRPN